MHPRPGDLALTGSARDLLTTAEHSEVVGAAGIVALVDGAGSLAELAVDPHNQRTGQLLGRPVAGGFRQAVHEHFPSDVAAGTPLALLLDDLPVATLISGYARLYSGDIPAGSAREGMKSDICSGWRSEGTMMTSVNAGLGVPVTVGPLAPTLDTDRIDDELAWHDIGMLPEGSMRRRRLVDVRTDSDRWIVTAMLRDTHVQMGGSETVLHEYSLDATVDAATRTFLTCAAVPRVLPWVECPVAAASADPLVGRSIDAARDYVRRELRGTSTCTHLNDLLRSLGDVGSLVNHLVATSPNRQDHAS